MKMLQLQYQLLGLATVIRVDDYNHQVPFQMLTLLVTMVFIEYGVRDY